MDHDVADFHFIFGTNHEEYVMLPGNNETEATTNTENEDSIISFLWMI